MFKDAIVLLEYRDQPTISWLFVIIKTLLHFLNGLEIEDSAIKQMCDILKAQIHKRFDNVMDEELFIVATYLDPATIDRLTSDETNKAREILTEWIGKIEYDREVENVTKKPKLSGEANLFSQLMGSRSQIKPNPGKNEDISAINAYVAEAASMFSQLDEVSFSSVNFESISNFNFCIFSAVWMLSTLSAPVIVVFQRFIKLLVSSFLFRLQLHRSKAYFLWLDF